jgi:D-ornithine 4,5-aminomutase subunit alpha
MEREDDFEVRGVRLRKLSDRELYDYFWSLVDKIVAPLIEEARSHTTASIERSVLLRMGFSSLECRDLVARMQEQGLLGHGAGRLVLELSRLKGISTREAGEALLEGRYWEGLPL